MLKTPRKEYQKRSRAARIAEGGKAVHVILTPEAATALQSLMGRLGLNATDTICLALQEMEGAGQ